MKKPTAKKPIPEVKKVVPPPVPVHEVAVPKLTPIVAAEPVAKPKTWYERWFGS